MSNTDFDWNAYHLKRVERLVATLFTLRTDAEMAIDGRWDTSDEGIEGFADQITLIDQVMEELSLVFPDSLTDPDREADQ